MTAFGPTLLFAIGEGAILPVIALGVRDRGGSVALAALVVTLIGIGSLVSNLPASVLTTRYGERWAIVGAGVWCALAMAICMVVPHLAAFTVGVFMIGMASAVFSLARQSYLTEAVPFHYRARALSTLGGVMRIGLFIGPFLGAAVIPFAGLAGAYGVGVVALVLSALLAARMPDLPGERQAAVLAAVAAAAADGAPRAPTIRAVTASHARILLTVGIGTLLVSAVRASRQAVVPLWADHLGLDAATTSLIYGLAGGIDMLVFYPAGKVMDRKGRTWVAVPSMFIMGAGLLFLPLAHSAATSADRRLGPRLRQRHRLGNDHDAGRRLLADGRPGALPRRLAADGGPRLDRWPGAHFRRNRAVLACRGHLLHRPGRAGGGIGALVLDSANRQATCRLRHTPDPSQAGHRLPRRPTCAAASSARPRSAPWSPRWRGRAPAAARRPRPRA